VHLANDDRWIEAKEMERRSGIGLRSIYNLMNMAPEVGGIPSFRVGPRSVRTKESDFVAWQRRQEQNRTIEGSLK